MWEAGSCDLISVTWRASLANSLPFRTNTVELSGTYSSWLSYFDQIRRMHSISLSLRTLRRRRICMVNEIGECLWIETFMQVQCIKESNFFDEHGLRFTITNIYPTNRIYVQLFLICMIILLLPRQPCIDLLNSRLNLLIS